MAPRMKVETSADQPTPKAVSTTPKKASTAAPKPVVAPAPTPADSVVEAPAPKPVSAPKPVDTVVEAPAPKPAPKPAEAPMPRLVEAPVNEPTPEQDQAQYYAYAEAPGPIPTPDPIPASDSAQTQAQDSTQDRARAHGSSDDQAPKQKRDINDMRHAVSGWVHRTFPGREHAFWGGVIALVVAVLVFAIGLPRMLFICLLVVVGVAIGQIADGDPKIIRAITSLFNSDRDQS